MRHSRATGQWITTSDGMHWFFDSGSTALDFAYTGGFVETADAPRTTSDLGDWLAERFPEVGAAAAAGDLVDADELRRAIARMAVAASSSRVQDSHDIDVINLFAATPDIPPALEGGTRQAGRANARVGQAFSAMAREAVDLFSGEKAQRIRECAADDCGLIFYDESRSNNRRWCSMQRCGNRAKVRAHRAKERTNA